MSKKKKFEMSKRVDLPLYHTTIQMYLSREALLADVDQGHEDEDDWGACAQIMEAEDGICVVCIAFREDKYMTTPIIAHECVHAAWDVLELAGVKVKFNNHEALAYMTEYLVKEVTAYVDDYFKHKKKAKKK